MSGPSRPFHSHPLRSLFAPEGVAVVGASRNPRKRGHQAVRALLAAGFAGPVEPVNPRGGTLLGLPVRRSVEEVEGPVELAVVCTPAPTVPGVVRACGRRGIGAAVVLAAGFREAGRKGAALQGELLEAARESDVRVLGPNTSGLVAPHRGLDLLGLDTGVRAGDIGLVSQSGNLALALLTEAAATPGVGFSLYAGVGNAVDVDFPECVDYLAAEPHTGVIVLYVEGTRNARALLDAVGRAAANTPVVVLRGARTETGVEAARSHTAAVASPYRVFRAAVRQRGGVAVDRTDELLPVARALAAQPNCRPPAGLAVVSDGGGHGTLAADFLEESGAPLATLGNATRAALRETLGDRARVDAPVDLAGAADAEPARFGGAVARVLADPAVGVVLVAGLFGGYARRFRAPRDEEVRAAGRIVDAATEHGKGVVVHSLYAGSGAPALELLAGAGIPVVRSLEVACRAAAALAERGRGLAPAADEPCGEDGSRTDGSARENAVALATDGPDPLREAVGDAAAAGRDALLEPAARRVVAARGVPVVEARYCENAAGAAEAAAAFAVPVAVKAVAHGLLHKAAGGGVELGVAPEEASDAFRRIRRRVEVPAGHTSSREPAFCGVLVAPLLPPPPMELLVGVRRDPDFGPLLALGAGGTAVERLADAAFRLLPAGEEEVREMLSESRAGRAALEALSPDALEQLLVLPGRLEEILIEETSVRSAELNPLFAYPDRVVTVDVRILLEEPSSREGAPS